MVTIRLARGGAKKRPYFHITVADSRRARDGKYIERVGFFNPIASIQNDRLNINHERLDYWVSKGAKVTDTVKNLIKQSKFSPEEFSKFLADKEDLRLTNLEKKKSTSESETAEDTSENSESDSTETVEKQESSQDNNNVDKEEKSMEKTEDIIDKVAEGTKEVTEEAAEAVTDVAEGAVDVAEDVVETAVDVVEDAADAVKDVAEGVSEAIDDAVDSVKDAFSSDDSKEDK